MGKIYKGKVVKIMEFGAFVNFLGKQDGLVHISELAAKRVEKVGDVVKEGARVLHADTQPLHEGFSCHLARRSCDHRRRLHCQSAG